jgi:MFS family permease
MIRFSAPRLSRGSMVRARIFYGWWIVVACLVSSLIGNALGLFGAGVYLRALSQTNGWPIGLVSGAATLFYVVSAVLLIPVGSGINHFGPRLVIGFGGLAMAGGVAGIGQVTAPRQAYLAFFAMGIGWACLSTTAVATTLAPWFEKYQGRAVSIASLGASVGGMIGTPILLFGIGRAGFAMTTAIAGSFAAVVLLPLALGVMRHRPRDIGLFPDGASEMHTVMRETAPTWTRTGAARTRSLRGVMIGFGIGMMVQIGFLTHQVTLLSQELSTTWISTTVSATAMAALCGRLALAGFADRIDARMTAMIALLLAAAALSAMALFPVPAVLIGGSVAFGLTVGNVTTLQPIIVRREFGAASFGAVFGVASCVIQLVTALGPGFYGVLHDACGGYRVPLLLAAVLDVMAAVVVVVARRQ